jgi:TetR/AcrR family transcriptional regulator, regulator of autoinduction and epiphytic fitness
MSTRRYSSPRREQAALATRAAILDAAGRLYVERGYAATRLSDIARAAEVAPATVKNAFGTKRALLEALVRARVVGDADARALGEREAWRAMLDEPDPHRLLRRYVELAADVHSRSAALIEAVTHGASADPDVADLARRGAQKRHDDVAEVIAALCALTPLDAELDATAATDALWAFTSPTVYLGLIEDRGWTRERWISATTRAVTAALLPAGSATAPGGRLGGGPREPA